MLLKEIKNRLTITPLLARVVVFLFVFACITGVVGPRIIESDILFRDGFEVYGGIGKAIIFGIIVFVLLVRHNKADQTIQRWQPQLLGWGFVSLVMLGVAWLSIDQLLAGERTFANLFLAHSGLLLSVAFAGLAIMGSATVKQVWHIYWREIRLTAAFMVAFYLFLQAVYLLWQPLASLVLVSVKALLEVSGQVVSIYPPHTLILDKFGITIAEFCSGVESIALFTSLYIIVGLLDWPRINQRRYFMIFPLALLVLCLFNIVRVYGLIMAGYYINPEIAFSLFHTYAGMIFFIIYSVIFWMVSYRYIVPGKARSA